MSVHCRQIGRRSNIEALKLQTVQLKVIAVLAIVWVSASFIQLSCHDDAGRLPLTKVTATPSIGVGSHGDAYLRLSQHRCNILPLSSRPIAIG